MSQPMKSFEELHAGTEPLLLPNAWDVASALAFADAGFQAIGTTSMGIAASAGHPDGRRASREATALLAEALEVVHAHISVDVEDGYSDDPTEVATFIEGLPIAGLNIEDSSHDHLIEAELHADKITAIKQQRPDLFVNARVDTYWLTQEANEEATLLRAQRYVTAGADGIFVPGITDPDVIARLASAIQLPLNILAIPGMSLTAAGNLGVRRVSSGSLPYRVALQAALSAITEIQNGGPIPEALAYPDLQASLQRYADMPLPPKVSKIEGR